MIKECKRKRIKEVKDNKMIMKKIMKMKMNIQMTVLSCIPMRKQKKRLRIRTKRRRIRRMILLNLTTMSSNQMKKMKTMTTNMTMTTKTTPSLTMRIPWKTTTSETTTTLNFTVSREQSRLNQLSSLNSKTNGCSQPSVDHESNTPMQFWNSSISQRTPYLQITV